MKKRLLSAILSFCMLLTMAPTVAFAAEDDEAAPQSSSVLEGSCGAKGSEGNVQWALTDDDGDGSYTLTISGSGAMADFTLPTKPDATGANVAPWYTALLADENTSCRPSRTLRVLTSPRGTPHCSLMKIQVADQAGRYGC